MFGKAPPPGWAAGNPRNLELPILNRRPGGTSSMNLKEIQKETGTTADGLMGPKTRAALKSAGYLVVIDAGHTTDQTREYPNLWPASAWQNQEWLSAAKKLGFTKTTRNSVEHILNCAIAESCRRELARRGVKALVYDDPSKANNPEFHEAVEVANAAQPRAFVSIHANGSKGVDGYLTNTACGTISFYREGRTNGKTLALALTEAALALRANSGGPNNRADKASATTAYYVLNAVNASIPAALCEVGFYDNLRDFVWMVKNIDSLGSALAAAIHAQIKR